MVNRKISQLLFDRKNNFRKMKNIFLKVRGEIIIDICIDGKWKSLKEFWHFGKTFFIFQVFRHDCFLAQTANAFTESVCRNLLGISQQNYLRFQIRLWSQKSRFCSHFSPSGSRWLQISNADSEPDPKTNLTRFRDKILLIPDVEKQVGHFPKKLIMGINAKNSSFGPLFEHAKKKGGILSKSPTPKKIRLRRASRGYNVM